jgi:isocitrate lyase
VPDFSDAKQLALMWESDPRWAGIKRPYSGEDVVRLRGSVQIDYTLARRGAERLWKSLSGGPYVQALGTMTGGQATQAAKAGLNAIYLSGWQVAADANGAGQTYPDQSLYPANSAPALVKRINNAFQRADQIQTMEGTEHVDYFLPIVADAEAGFGGALNVHEIMKAFIEAGAAGVHLEDQLASEKKCGHMGGKVLIPTKTATRNLISARLAADLLGVPTLIVARTDADAAQLITSDTDPYDLPFISGERTEEGFCRLKGGKGGLDMAIARGLAYAPYADLIWCETSEPSIAEAKRFAEGIHAKFPGKWLAYNCSPSFNWKLKLPEKDIATFQDQLSAFGYKFQFITLAGFHALNHSFFQLALDYKARGMAAYSELQQAEFANEEFGYTATRHQREVGAGYFDEIAQVVAEGKSSTTALSGSTEEAQFGEKQPAAAAH